MIDIHLFIFLPLPQSIKNLSPKLAKNIHMLVFILYFMYRLYRSLSGPRAVYFLYYQTPNQDGGVVEPVQDQKLSVGSYSRAGGAVETVLDPTMVVGSCSPVDGAVETVQDLTRTDGL